MGACVGVAVCGWVDEWVGGGGVGRGEREKERKNGEKKRRGWVGGWVGGGGEAG